MGEDGQRGERSTGRGPVFVPVAGAVLILLLVVLLVPLVVGVLPRGAGSDGPREAMPPTWPLLVNTVLASACVGVLAGMIGTLVAWTTRAVGSTGAALMLWVMALPPYLAYAGWGVLRAPGTQVGDWIGSLPGARSGEVGHAASVVLAVAGLALWAWPLAAVLVGAHVRRLDPDLVTMIDHESRSALSRWAMRFRIVAPSIGASALLAGLLVAGTAIPLHLANVPTLAIKVWLLLDRSPPDQAWRAYVAAWPLWVMAVATGWWIGGRAVSWSTGQRPTDGGRRDVQARWPGWLVLLAAVALSTGVPAALLISRLKDPASFMRFWKISGDATAHGAIVAALTGAAAVLVAAMVGVCAGGGTRTRRVAAWFVRGMAMLGLAPGVLVGSALVTGWTRIDHSGVFTSSVAIEVVAHVARLGWVGAFAGCALVRLEHPHLRDLRRLDGGDTLAGYARTGLLLHAPVLAAIGLVTALLSFTEIEVSIVVSPPGSGNLARQILNYLHFARLEEMSAAAGWIVGAGILCAISVGLLTGARSRSERVRAVSS